MVNDQSQSDEKRVYYKVVRVDEKWQMCPEQRTRFRSVLAPQGLALEYAIGRWTTAEVGGSGILVFDSLSAAREFEGKLCCQPYTRVMECLVSGSIDLPTTRIMLLSALDVHCLSFVTERVRELWQEQGLRQEHANLAQGSWPAGTHAFRSIKPIRTLEGWTWKKY